MVPIEVLSLFTHEVKTMLMDGEKTRGPIEEIRVRVFEPVECIDRLGFYPLDYVMNEERFRIILDQLFQSSRYRFTRELREGFITLSGGHRVGLCGEVVMNGDGIDHIETITSLNIRIQHNKHVPFRLSHRQLFQENRYVNTLIIGPPNSGKTSLLRFLIQSINDDHLPYSKKIGVIDERKEILPAMSYRPSTTLRVDAFSGCPKHLALPLIIRAMSPELIVIDEIATHQDVEALLDGMKAGVSLICTVHGTSYDDVCSRLFFHQIIKHHLFDYCVTLDPARRGIVSIKSIVKRAII
ncbi:stage III sporulation protein AA [Halolactibacillus miurensis]|uniref:Stage III sporulation protein AA n=1 Tax=Halolactibacillus miurensis TaxID=306541 RepID=A0A1I6PSB1_9BACI|nr:MULTISPECIES: ATPase, T2SS/T4P/T4SS family [Halolactibacillus]GEM04419.1 stage III sporulation protein AA [Halolactibacillus miurensis]SFS43093.1 stage III sporulation protein AA [Halolactibacillus miurensis]